MSLCHCFGEPSFKYEWGKYCQVQIFKNSKKIYSTLSIAQPLGEKKNNLRLSPTKIKNKCEEGRDLERKVSKGSKTYR